MADQPPADNCVADLTPLGGLRVVDLSTTRAGAFVTQFLADAGADVVLVESPAGHPLRSEPAWPALARGKRSVSADIHIDADRDLVAGLVSEADVVISTFGSAEADDLGLGAAELAARNPRLVSVSITGWGPSGPWCDLPDHEGLVMAKTGMFHAKRRITTRPGPSYISVPFASWGAAQAALHGLLAALLEREGSGQGQHVEADLVRGAGLFDTWSWFTELVGIRWPEAYEVVDAYTPDGEPTAPLVYPLLVAPTSDGHWLQFAQVQPRLFAAMIAEFGLTSVLADPRWAGFPVLDRQELRTEMWELMIETVRQRTLAEWIQVFETSPDLNAEIFRSGPGSLDHPQLKHDGRVATVDDPLLGPVRQPSTLVHSDERPLRRLQPAPRLDGDGPAVRATTETGARSGVVAPGHDAPSGDPPLAGITVIELGVMFAAPFGSTLLADLGARVIKVESLEGDGIRHILSFPELGGARVMQGKESIALDLDTPEGRRLVHELAGQADIVLQGFRAGAAARAGVDADTLRAENPALIYVNAPGYGTSGPFGTRPAYAPSIGAAAGLALADAPDAAGATSTMAEIKAAAIRLSGASAVPSLQADGIAALGVATAMLLGLVGRARSRPLGARQ
jgi:crotonobetainyl-CoA:carnitine CoA-transferase CaiB-like acyl-CoA transferase